MSTLSNVIHDAVADVEAFIAEVERLFGHKPPAKVTAAVATITAQAKAVDPTQPAAPIPPAAAPAPKA
jgi:hypothetical protein